MLDEARTMLDVRTIRGGGQDKQLPSLRTVLFVSHRARSITVVERDGSAWTERELRGGEVVSLPQGIALEL